MQPGTAVYPFPESATVYDSVEALKPRLGLNEILEKAASLGTEPDTFAVGKAGPFKNVFASAIAAKDATGTVVAIWLSEWMFSSTDAALDHAEDLLGCEIFPLICGDCFEQ